MIQRASIAGLLLVTFARLGLGDDITGIWGPGTYELTEHRTPATDPDCPGTFTTTGAARLRVTQQGNSLRGLIELNDVFDGCPPATTDVVFPVWGNFQQEGELVDLLILAGDQPAKLSGWARDDVMELWFQSSPEEIAEGTYVEGSVTLPISEDPNPFPGDLTGTWFGSYSVSDPCITGSIASSGPLEAAFFDEGSAVSGTLTVLDVVEIDETRCAIVRREDFVLTFSGTRSGNTLSGDIVDEENLSPVDLTIDGNSMTGTIHDPFAPVSIVLSRAGSQPLPDVTSFTASPVQIPPGGRSTLVWSTRDAGTVSISGVSGTFPPVGSTTVMPSTTTNYTLSASGLGGTTEASVQVEIVATPEVKVGVMPSAIIQDENAGGATSSYVLTNVGGASTSITLSQTGSFFTQSPTSFSLDPGKSQLITLTGSPVAAGAYAGSSDPSGTGVPPALKVPVRLLASAAPVGEALAKAVSSRVDVSAPEGQDPTGTATFENEGTATLDGILTANVPWIVPQSEAVSIPGGETRSVSFTVHRSLRDANDVGSTSGVLSLTFRTTGAGSRPSASVPVSSTLVTIIDTTKPTVTTGAIPPLAEGEIAFFIPGVGHVLGSVGLFLSDIAITNRGAENLSNVRMFYTPLGGAPTTPLTTTVASVPSVQPLAIADVVNNVFDIDGQVGSLQIRASSPESIAINANILNVSNAAGTYGTVIPIFRSDRSAGPAEQIYLTGLRSDATSHTNLFIQETSGAPVEVITEFLDTGGAILSTRSDRVEPFRLLQILNPAPIGSVAAILRSKSTSAGRFSAYATPVDRESGDTWAVADWTRELSYSGGERAVVPVAGAVHGTNSTYFRTDVAIMATGGGGTGLLRYYDRSGPVIDRTVNLGTNQSFIANDVVTTTFDYSTDTLGHLVFTPQNGTFVVTSRTYTTVIGKNATFGTGVPTLPVTPGIRGGTLRRIGSFDDASFSTIVAARPATFRTNFALLETSGKPVTVRATLYFDYATTSLVTARSSVSKDYPLRANELLLVSSIAKAIIGDTRESLFGDLTNLQVDFAVVSGEGSVEVFTSSLDNGTGDSILRIE